MTTAGGVLGNFQMGQFLLDGFIEYILHFVHLAKEGKVVDASVDGPVKHSLQVLMHGFMA